MSLLKSKSIIWERRIPLFVVGIATSIIVFNYFEQILNYFFYLITAIIGYFSLTQKNAFINGMLYGSGFFISNFLMIDEEKSLTYIISFGTLFLVMGMLLGLALTYIGYSVRVLTRKKK